METTTIVLSIVYLVTIISMVKLLRYCNNTPEHTGWETDGHEFMILIITLFPFLNTIILIVIISEIFLSKGDILAKLFKSKKSKK